MLLKFIFYLRFGILFFRLNNETVMKEWFILILQWIISVHNLTYYYTGLLYGIYYLFTYFAHAHVNVLCVSVLQSRGSHYICLHFSLIMNVSICNIFYWTNKIYLNLNFHMRPDAHVTPLMFTHLWRTKNICIYFSASRKI